MTMSTPMLVTFTVYIFGMVLIGLLAYRATNNFDDYILGGRSLGSVVTALSAGASDMSGWLLMGLPGAIFLSGISESWIAIGLTIGAYLNWKLVAGRLRVHTEANNNALTLPDYFTSRFEDNSKLLRVISAIVIPGVLHHLLRLRHRSRRAPVRKHLRHELRNRPVGRRRGDHPLHLYRRFHGGKLDRYRAGQPDDFRADPDAGDRHLRRRRHRYFDAGDRAQNPANLDMLKGLNFVAILSLLGWGTGYFGQPHIWRVSWRRILTAPSAARVASA